MNNKPTGLSRWRRGRRGGSAMLEFSLIIPVLAIVTALTFFVGWAMVNLLNVSIADRYAAWRYVYDGNNSVQSPTADIVRAKFLSNADSNVSVTQLVLTPSSINQLMSDAAQQGSQDAGTYANLTIPNFPTAQGATVVANFPPPYNSWKRFTWPLTNSCIRDGGPWELNPLYLNGGQVPLAWPKIDTQNAFFDTGFVLSEFNTNLLQLSDQTVAQDLKVLLLACWPQRLPGP